MRMGGAALGAMAAIGLMAGAAQAALVNKKPPYYASIGASKARMRTGPGRNYPASWLYRRAELPVRVTAIYADWRKVEDPDGTQGWILANLLRDVRTAMVRGSQPVELHETASGAGRVLWRAAPGVIGRVSKCARGWCWLDMHGRGGYIEVGRIWGVDASETLG